MPINPRPPTFALDSTLPRHWYAGKIFESHFFNALSSLLPEGERFVIQASRQFSAHTTGREQQQALAAFIKQEANHSKVHDQHMKLLVEQGFAALANMNRFFRSVMSTYLKYLPRYSLAVAAGVEHLTASLAQTLAQDTERWLQPMHEPMAQFWHWHAIEELEHKAVTFDLYHSANLDYPLRILALIQVLIGFSVDVFARHVYLLYQDDALFDGEEWRRGGRFLLGKQGLFANLMPELGRYLRRDFHPANRDDNALIAAFDKPAAQPA